MATNLEILIKKFKYLGIDKQLDYNKYYLYSLITHSTAIEGSTLTELENQIMFEEGISIKGKSLTEQWMNLDLKVAYERCLEYSKKHKEITIDFLIDLTSLVMKNTGKEYRTALGDFSSSKGELRLLNVTAGVGGKSYLSFDKVECSLKILCEKLNKIRAESSSLSLLQKYELSFDAHFHLVTIHPWADGNGRMARLLMHYIQFEYGLIPLIIYKEDKEEYIKSLVSTRESGDLNMIRNYFTELLERNLENDIRLFNESTENNLVQSSWEYYYPKAKLQSGLKIEKYQNAIKQKSRDKIINLLKEDGRHTIQSLSQAIGIGPKAIEKQIQRLKKSGILHRNGPDKGGYWEITSN